MCKPDSAPSETETEKLGIFGSWRRLYLAVAGYTIVMIFLLHLLGSEASC